MINSKKREQRMNDRLLQSFRRSLFALFTQLMMSLISLSVPLMTDTHANNRHDDGHVDQCLLLMQETGKDGNACISIE